ncbi:hypothetical protein FOCC_FOCC003814 [Frankliniella occidentalis]|nr:hypothetical protein FOCC_FOCC003814 [Frankliniella occidentalis]
MQNRSFIPYLPRSHRLPGAVRGAARVPRPKDGRPLQRPGAGGALMAGGAGQERGGGRRRRPRHQRVHLRHHRALPPGRRPRAPPPPPPRRVVAARLALHGAELAGQQRVRRRRPGAQRGQRLGDGRHARGRRRRAGDRPVKEAGGGHRPEEDCKQRQSPQDFKNAKKKEHKQNCHKLFYYYKN